MGELSDLVLKWEEKTLDKGPGDGAFATHHVATDHAVTIGEDNSVKGCTNEDRAVNADRPGEVSSAEVRVTEVCFGQVGSAEIDAGKVGPTQVVGTQVSPA